MATGVWIVAVTHVNSERKVAFNLAQQGYEYYLPRFREMRFKDGRIAWRDRVLFPRYVFVRVFTTWRSLLHTFGVATLIMDGERPAHLADREVDLLRSRQDSDGFVSLPKPPSRFQVGQSVRIDEGPLTGFNAIYDGMASDERVRVLLDMLGSKRTVVLKEQALSPV